MNTTQTMTLGSPAAGDGRHRFPARVGAMLTAWAERHRSRRALAALDTRMLRDIGVSRADQRRECNKPFWRD